ncbi:MAG TPA: hypothetical protein VFS43_01050 [Polyangiaceae bacterium]|nr:hypothetical protein [Polyangiaceae bacterium]
MNRIGTYLVHELVRARDAFASAPDGGPFAALVGAEVSVAFASADGLPVEPVVSAGDEPLPPDALVRWLEPLERRVLVAQADVKKADEAARGRLVLRVALEGA